VQWLRQSLILLAVTSTFSWLYLTVSFGLLLLPQAPGPLPLGPLWPLFILSYPLQRLSVPLAASTATLAVVERLLARRWEWRVCLPVLAVGAILLPSWIFDLKNYDNLLVTVQQHFGWSYDTYFTVVSWGMVVAFALGAALEFIFALQLRGDTLGALAPPGDARASGRTD
jgi:hypothetical protein